MSGSGWLLGGGYSWRTAAMDIDPSGPFASVVANDQSGLSLASLAAGALGLESPDGSLGQLTLPVGVALEGDTLLTLTTPGDRVLRYDPVKLTMAPLPAIGAEGLDPRSDGPDVPDSRRFRG